MFPIEIVSSFNCLGCEISSSGSFKNCIENLVSSAKRALFSLKRYFNKNRETLPEVQIRLFDAMVAPITYHGCEVWGLRKADLIEKFHLSFLKSILRVKISTTNCYVYGEFGIFPFLIERKVRVIKYWLKIIRSLNQNENYIQKIYKELIKINIEKPNISTWVSETKHLLESTGFGYIWQQQVVYNENEFLRLFKRRLCDMYLQEWEAEINLTTDGRLYKQLNKKFIFESYLKINNASLRIAISKIRLSSHLFFVERGRWGQRKIERRDRLCQFCNCIEDEFHVLLFCPMFNNAREGLLPEFLRKDKNMVNFLRFINSKKQEEQKKLGILCHKVQKEYKQLL